MTKEKLNQYISYLTVGIYEDQGKMSRDVVESLLKYIVELYSPEEASSIISNLIENRLGKRLDSYTQSMREYGYGDLLLVETAEKLHVDIDKPIKRDYLMAGLEQGTSMTNFLQKYFNQLAYEYNDADFELKTANSVVGVPGFSRNEHLAEVNQKTLSGFARMKQEGMLTNEYKEKLIKGVKESKMTEEERARIEIQKIDKRLDEIEKKKMELMEEIRKMEQQQEGLSTIRDGLMKKVDGNKKNSF